MPEARGSPLSVLFCLAPPAPVDEVPEPLVAPLGSVLLPVPMPLAPLLVVLPPVVPVAPVPDVTFGSLLVEVELDLSVASAPGPDETPLAAPGVLVGDVPEGELG